MALTLVALSGGPALSPAALSRFMDYVGARQVACFSHWWALPCFIEVQLDTAIPIRHLALLPLTTMTSRLPLLAMFILEKSITIDKSPAELYSFWREFENLPQFMKHLESVRRVGLNRWHWVAKGPLGTTVEWDAEIYNEKPNELKAWRSLEGADITNAGSVHFIAGPRGTQVKVNLNYNAPGGKVSALMAKLFGQEPGQMIETDLRRLKQVLETGEIATVEGQPSGRNEQAEPLRDGDSSKVGSNIHAIKFEGSRKASAGGEMF